MNSRRTFIKQSSLAGMALAAGKYYKFDLFNYDGNNSLSYESRFIKFQVAADKPLLTYISADSLGRSQFNVNPLLEIRKESNIHYNSKVNGNKVTYRKYADENSLNEWQVEGRNKEIIFKTWWKENENSEPFNIVFNQNLNHCTVLGTMPEKKQVHFPCVLHFPGMGTFRVYCSDKYVNLFYDACRNLENSISPDPKGEYDTKYVKIALPAADKQHPEITYTFELVAIFPDLDILKNDSRFDGFKKNFINIFQLNPRIRSLANNSSSDACTFTVYLYAEMARKTPELVKGLTAMDLVRNTLDRYMEGMKGYGQVGYSESYGWTSRFNSSDSLPSLIISACYYILHTKDYKWADRNYSLIKGWADEMISTDKNNDGIIEYGYSGNADSWYVKEENKFNRPANWWDTIGFGHNDAYSNALAYKACILLSETAEYLNISVDSRYFASFADKLKSTYYNMFFNPSTGILAGWKSEDGKLHDYYFTFVNSIAICYGLIDNDKAISIMNSLLKKMKEVGYTDFKLGLPGNLIPVRREDYTVNEHRWGYGEKEDGSDGFQIYENGGATGCYAYFTIHALFKLGMHKEAEEILFPMLDSYAQGKFEGQCKDSEMTKDWKTWNWECCGYEGFLVDNYQTFLAVLDL